MAKTLLLADDSVTIQKVVTISFASEDVTLITVDNGDDAVERAKETRPDLILADVVMPGKSGYEVCEELKADPDLQHIPVLLLSGTFEAFDEERAAKAGAAGHIAKPFEAQTLVNQVNELLAAAPPPAPAATPTPLAPPEAVTMVPPDSQDAASFDFFDDDLEEFDVPSATDSDEALALDDAEALEAPVDLDPSASAFGTAEPTPPEVIPQTETPAGDLGGVAAIDPPIGASSPEPISDHTIAILPDDLDEPLSSEIPPTALIDDSIGIDPHDQGEEMLSSAAYALEDSFLTGDASATSDEAFDFSFEQESTAPEAIPVGMVMDAESAEDDLIQGTVLDPGGLAGFGVAEPEIVDPITPEAIPSIEPPADSTRLMDADALFHEPEAIAEIADSDAAAEPMPEPEPMELNSPIESVLPTASPAEEARSLPDDSAARAEAVLAQIAPSLQESLHDTLEKIAWESFGELTEKIVQDVVDRVEKIAWEVIPQMTETLVKAEIDRLKGDEPD